MKWLVSVLLAAEAVLVACTVTQAIASNLAVLLLAGNSVLLIWAGARWRRRPSCCR